MEHIRVIPGGDIFIENIDCRLQCVFCNQGIRKTIREKNPINRSLFSLANLVKRILLGPEAKSSGIIREFESVIGKVTLGEVIVAAYDLLEFTGLFELLDICARHGKKVTVISPGLRLADREFAKKLSSHVSRLVLTYLSHDHDTYYRMVGNPEAINLVQKAILNLKELDVDFSVNYVMTSLNGRDLMDVAGFLIDEVGLKAFTLVFFFPERCHLKLNPNIADLFVPFPQLSEEVLKFAKKYQGTENNLSLSHVPPCKLDEKVLDCENINHGAPAKTDENVLIHHPPECKNCKYEDRCPFVFELYHQTYPDEPCDYAKVNKYIDKLKA